MQLKELGRTGAMTPEVGLGTWKYRGGVEPLHRGIELGAYLIDTAEMYRTEDVVGQAVRGIRQRVQVATKVLGSNLRYDRVMRAMEGSLRLLDMDYVDLYQIHWPNSSVPVAETMRAMEDLVDSGMARYIGVSNFSLRQLQEAQAAMTRHPIVSNQVLYSLKQRSIERDLLPYCQQNAITLMAYTPLASGSLAVSAAAPSGESGASLRRAAGRLLGRNRGIDVLQQVAREAGKTPAQVALNWCTSRPNVIVIPKSDSVTRTEENCGASGWRLSAEQVRRLDDAFPV
jgi:diketogulonate reductase-like aldo/keto reductase